MNLPWKGKRNVLGTIEPSRSSGSLNGYIRALLVGSGDNNDVKNPIRIAITAHTHEKSCLENCVTTSSRKDMIEAMEASQAAQVGYHCDYCCKRHPCGVRECNEWSKGHVSLEKIYGGAIN